MSNPATPSSFTRPTPKSWDPSSTPKGTSWSVFYNATPRNESILVQWTHFDENGFPTTPFERGSIQSVQKVDTLNGEPIYEWETALNDPALIGDLIKQEGWVVDPDIGSIFLSFEPLNP